MRAVFSADLEQLRLQVEVMALKVDEALRSATAVLESGDTQLAQQIVDRDDEIDEMFVSLTERCYDLLCRQNPMASDLRLIVSVLRALSDLERIGDLCLRLVKAGSQHPEIRRRPETFSILLDMASAAADLFSTAITSWTTQDLRLARTLEERDDLMDAYNERLMVAILDIKGDDAVPIAVNTLLAGRALERIADHSVMVAERVRYLLTGDIRSISKEIGP